MNTHYYGDNLNIMREYVPDDSVGLIYHYPPFNSKQAYNVIFRDKEGYFPPSQIEAFDYTWHWMGAIQTLNEAPRIEGENYGN